LVSLIGINRNKSLLLYHWRIDDDQNKRSKNTDEEPASYEDDCEHPTGVRLCILFMNITFKRALIGMFD